MENSKSKPMLMASSNTKVACNTLVCEYQYTRTRSSDILSAHRGHAPKYERMKNRANRLVKIFDR